MPIRGVGNVVVWKDVSERALFDSNRTTALDWTDLDLTAYISASAKFALIRAWIKPDTVGTGVVAYIAVRKNGTTPSHYPIITLHKAGAEAGQPRQEVLIIGLDADQVMEYKIHITTGWQVDSFIDVLGYIE